MTACPQCFPCPTCNPESVMTELDTQGRPIPGSAPTARELSEMSGSELGDYVRSQMISWGDETLDDAVPVVNELLRRLAAAEQRADAAERERDALQGEVFMERATRGRR